MHDEALVAELADGQEEQVNDGDGYHAQEGLVWSVGRQVANARGQSKHQVRAD